jgi:hypothetical protein
MHAFSRCLLYVYASLVHGCRFAKSKLLQLRPYDWFTSSLTKVRSFLWSEFSHHTVESWHNYSKLICKLTIVSWLQKGAKVTQTSSSAVSYVLNYIVSLSDWWLAKFREPAWLAGNTTRSQSSLTYEQTVIVDGNFECEFNTFITPNQE